jgi:dynein light chain LC8-type|eukprot:g1488.t1
MAANTSTQKRVTDMDEHSGMIAEAEQVAARATQQCDGDESKISKEIKLYFDDKFGPTWHCIVGGNFKAFVTHEAKTFLFFYSGKNAVLLYKAQ